MTEECGGGKQGHAPCGIFFFNIFSNPFLCQLNFLKIVLMSQH